MPLERKIQISQARIIEWYKHWNGHVVVSFSGGKDSTVLLHLVRSIYPDVRAVFSNTGLEYPEIQRHVRGIENVDIVTPAMRFDEVISTYGYPLIGKEVAEAIYYARRIRSQSVNVERERESSRGTERRTTRTNSWSNTSDGNLPGTASPTSHAPGKEITERLQRGGVLQSIESSRDTAAGWNARSSHRDKHCEEQTNSPDGKDGPRVRDRTGVVDGKLNASNGGGDRETDRRRNDLEGKHQHTPRIRNGGITIRGKDGDTNSEDSEPG